MFDQDSIYIVGEAKSPSNNPITDQYKVFFIGFVVDERSGKILDADCSAILELTSRFVQHLFAGKAITAIDEVTADIERKYHGSSQKAIIAAFTNASKKYSQLFVHTK
ncbi:DUF3870 domain-containing protein [Sinobaca sp. H24]|uniref:DUF3870 domain-containing protein n=1 Tax=Sinobaca sp. H24 TaxID=2923376 RepID=UPI00207A45AF|nr:DUF3870 domain-containing protein [Sinobaca sp. H24]